VTILILAMLLIVWAVVLGPSLWRRYSAQHADDSIHAFRRALRALRILQTPVLLVAPANELRPSGTASQGWRLVAGDRRRLAVARPLRLVPVLERRGPVEPATRSAAERRRGAGPSPASGASTRKRRRDVLVGLVASAIGAAVLGALPPLHPLLVVALVVVMVLVGYLVLLVRLRTEEEMRRTAHAVRQRHRPSVPQRDDPRAASSAGSWGAPAGTGSPGGFADDELPRAKVAAR
jgi:hypothetical protein